MINQTFELFGDVESFIRQDEEFSSNTRAKLTEFFTDKQKLDCLKVEFAAIVDAGKQFVQATYKLEGDGPLAFQCYEVISTLSTSVMMENYPNVQAVVRNISRSTEQQQKWRKYARKCITPALDYYKEHLEADIMSTPFKAFKAARLFDPHYLNKVKPQNVALNLLSVLPFNTDPILAHLKEEYPQYAAAAEGISSECETITFWKQYANGIPKWKEIAARVLLLQPSSAAAECVFSILKNSFSDQQLSALEDYLEASLILQYNK